MRRIFASTPAAGLVALAILLLPAPALAGGPDPAQDCAQHLRLTRSYTRQQLQHALNNLPSDVQEYSQCYDIIQQAELAAATGHRPGGGGGSGGPGAGGASAPGAGGTGPGGAAASPVAAATSAQAQAKAAAAGTAADNATRDGRSALRIAGATIRPGTVGTLASRGIGALPTPLLVVLVLLAAGAAAGAALGIRSRVLARRRA